MLFAHIGKSFKETFPGRASEWALGIMLFNWAVILILVPDVFSMQAYYSGMAAIMQQSSWALLFLVVSGTRLTVLLVNGLWRRSPVGRALTSWVSSLIWLQVAIGLIQSGIVNTGLAIYPVLFGLDVFNAIRAMGDAGRSDAHHKRVAGHGTDA